MPREFCDFDEYLLNKAKEKTAFAINEVVSGLSARLDKMQRMLEVKALDPTYDFDELVLIREDKLSSKFKMPEMKKFNGNEDLKVHLKQYVVIIRTTQLSKSQIVKSFVLSLEGPIVN